MLKQIIFLAAILILLLNACKKQSIIPVNSSEIKTVQISADELRVEGNQVIWEPERNIKRSDYETYYFKLTNFSETSGDPGQLTEPVSIEIQVVQRPETKTYQPENDLSQSPDGGFQITEYDAVVIKKL